MVPTSPWRVVRVGQFAGRRFPVRDGRGPRLLSNKAKRTPSGRGGRAQHLGAGNPRGSYPDTRPAMLLLAGYRARAKASGRTGRAAAFRPGQSLSQAIAEDV